MDAGIWAALGWQAWLTIGVVVLVLSVLGLTQLATDMILVGAVALLLLAGVLTAGEALSGPSN